MSGRFLTTVAGRTPGDHVCWPFHGLDGLVDTAREYALEGLNRHERVSFCRLSPSGSRYADVSSVGEVGRPPAADVPVLTSLTTDSAWSPAADPVLSLGAMTDAALADGFTGLRVLADATELARDPDTRADWVRSEHLIDRYALDHRITVLCAFDVDQLGEEPVAEVACVHGLTGGMPSTFLLRAVDGNGGLALTGEVDRGSAAALHHAIRGIAAATSGPLVLDLTELEFIDHTGLVALHRGARARGTHVHLVGASPLTTLMVDALALTGVSVLVQS